jgi:hypothetical protein
MKRPSYELPSELDPEVRKNTGAFYTPPDIVDFMVGELLRNRKLPLRICDAACGGGAFLEGVLRYVRKNAPETFKACCQNLRGMDINPNALLLAQKNLPDIPKENFICADTLELEYPAEKPFDIIIGNPPYLCGGLKNNASFPRERQQQLKKRFPESFEYKMNLFALFMEQSTRMADEFSLIVPDSFLCGRYFSRLRRYLAEEFSLQTLLILENPAFDAAPGNAVILHAARKKSDSPLLCAALPPGGVPADIPFYPNDQRRFLEEERFRYQPFFSETEEKIINKLRRIPDKVKDHFKFASGIIGKAGKNALISKEAAPNCVPGIIYGREIRPFEIRREGFFLDITRQKIKSGLDHERFSDPRIFVRQTGSRLICAVSREKLYALNNCHTGTPTGDFPLETLAALLNSSILNFYYAFISGEHNKNFAQIDIDLLNQLPLKRTPAFDRFAATCTNAPEDLEELDIRCARLFGITPKELAWIKKSPVR